MSISRYIVVAVVAFGQPHHIIGVEPGVAACSMRAARWVVWPTAV